MWKKLNENGRIPVNTDCPYRDICHIDKNGQCNHYGKNHGFDFSCATARAFDITFRDNPNNPILKKENKK